MLETPTRATAMVMPLGDLRAWSLSVHCPACRVLRHLTVAEIIEQTSAATLVRDILPKLTCKRCGTAPSFIQLWDVLPGTLKGPGRSVQLMG